MTGRNTGSSAGMTCRGWFRVRLGCAAASAIVFGFAVIVIGSLTPAYDQWSDAVSQLASPGERWALAARAAFAAYGLLIMAGASPLRHYGGRHGHTLARCLTLYGVACVIAGVAPKDQPGATHTAASEVHVAAAVLAGTLAIGAMTLVSRCGLTRATRRAAAAMALLTGLAAGSASWPGRCMGSANGSSWAWACAGSPRSPSKRSPQAQPLPPTDLHTNMSQRWPRWAAARCGTTPSSGRDAPTLSARSLTRLSISTRTSPWEGETSTHLAGLDRAVDADAALPRVHGADPVRAGTTQG
jgi:hypothetical protein